jgi:phosphatidate cytidylyltransferase
MNLALRVVSGAVLVGIAAGALWVGVAGLAALVAIGALVSAWEYSGLVRAVAVPPAWLLYPLTLWLALRFAFPAAYVSADWPLIAAVFAGLLALVTARAAFRRWGTALAGAVYIGFCLGFFIALYRWHAVDPDHFGLRLVGLTLLCVVAGDTVAYFAGTAIGRHRFFASISPHKTLEGAIAGAAASILLATFAGPPLTGISAAAGIGLGALIAIAAQGGDLVESKLKRDAGVKDSSLLIPGHGGLLDRVDSLVLVAPVVYCYLKLIALA